MDQQSLSDCMPGRERRIEVSGGILKDHCDAGATYGEELRVWRLQ
jgi:hypothetical protein